MDRQSNPDVVAGEGDPMMLEIPVSLVSSHTPDP